MKPAKFFPPCMVPMLPQNTFSGRVAFVTGGGTGLGKAMTTLLCSLGANAAIVGRRKDVLEKAAVDIEKQTGRVVLPLSMDVRDAGAVKETVDEVISKLGLPSLVINNAAGNFISPFHRLSPNAWKTIIDIVLNGTAHVTMDIGKRMIQERSGGSILSISATYARCGSGFVAPSAAAKAGVEALMKSLACEWGQYGIRLNCIAPGPIETKGAFSRLDPSGMFSAMALKKIPTGRFGEPLELANLASYVLSDFANWMTGEVLTLDGGEYPMGAGEFSGLIKVDEEQWDILEQTIRNANKEQKR